MSAIRLAAAQIVCRPGDLPHNLVRHREMLAEARAMRVDLLVFPELSLPDYVSAPAPGLAA